ncbi:DUF4143 domain-containing protein [Bilophila wadsworthia]|uniref:DUF4143 domain-containing protein n=1 Tax=Bilophila wadsworthia TaxID=35833 RepID=UPI003D76311D
MASSILAQQRGQVVGKTPKLYFLDTGLVCYLTGWTSPETAEAGAMSGALFETWVDGANTEELVVRRAGSSAVFLS